MRQKRPREKAEAHLAFIRTLPCVVTGRPGVEAAHIRFGSLIHGKRPTGMSEKPSDKWVLPLSPEEHRRQHDGNEQHYWRRHGIDPLVIAALLWAATGDEEAGQAICENARRLVIWEHGG
jgi:hypothetical protein